MSAPFGSPPVWQMLGLEVNYPRIVSAIWADPWQIAKQVMLIAAVWLHLCFGIHFWLRLKDWYPRAQQYLFAVAVLLPALALAGFVSAGIDVMRRYAALRLRDITRRSGTPRRSARQGVADRCAGNRGPRRAAAEVRMTTVGGSRQHVCALAHIPFLRAA